MKIMICISQLKKGGAERVVNNLSNYLIAKNDVVVVSLKNYEAEYCFDDKIKIINVDSKNNINRLKKIWNRIVYLKKIIKEEKPNIILCFLTIPSFLILFEKLFFRIKNVKIIISVRNDPKVEYKKIFNKIIMKLLYPLADGFVFQTEDAKKYFSNRIQKNSTIIYNSLNPDFLVDKPFVGTRKNEIVSVGRFFPQKNHKLLINAFSKIIKDFPNYKLVIYGEGYLRKDLEKQIEELGLNNSVLLPGIYDDIVSKIYDVGIFVLSSNYEGMPNSLMEAMTLGLPCISTDCPCGGPRTLIDDNINGMLFEVNNEKELVEKIKYLVTHKDFAQKIGDSAFKIREKINPDIINKKWENYFNYVINK